MSTDTERAARYWRVLGKWQSAHIDSTEHVDAPSGLSKDANVFHKSRVHRVSAPCHECLAAKETRP